MRAIVQRVKKSELFIDEKLFSINFATLDLAKRLLNSSGKAARVYLLQSHFFKTFVLSVVNLNKTSGKSNSTKEAFFIKIYYE